MDAEATLSDVARRVRAWLDEEGFGTRAVQTEGLEFSLQAGDVTISRPAGSNKILVGAVADLAPERARLGALDAAPRASLLADIAWLMHERSAGFRLEEDDGRLKRVLMLRAVYDDGLSKDRLMTAVAEMRAAVALVLLHVGRCLAATPPPDDASRAVAPAAASGTCPSCGAPARQQGKFCERCGARLP